MDSDLRLPNGCKFAGCRVSDIPSEEMHALVRFYRGRHLIERALVEELQRRTRLRGRRRRARQRGGR